MLLFFGVAVDLALLGYYKYANFLVENLKEVALITWNPQHIVLPLGISFFTFTQIAYLVDSYRRIAREYNPFTSLSSSHTFHT